MSAETFILCGITVTFDLQIRDIVHDTIITKHSEIDAAISLNLALEERLKCGIQRLVDQGVFNRYGPFTLDIAGLFVLDKIHRVHSLHYGNGKVIVVYDKVVTAKEISA